MHEDQVARRGREALEARLRELEARMAKLEGKATGALAEAYAVVLKEHLSTKPPPPGEGSEPG